MLIIFVSLLFPLLQSKSTGILYEIWHTRAAQQMQKVQQKGGTLLTTEKVIRSNGKYTLDDVYKKYGLGGDIWNVEPELGFYCLYRKRENDTHPPVPDCLNITNVLAAHAKMMVEAGIDYVVLDITNWIQVDTETDIWVLRPSEVLFEEWKKLRDQGIQTPQIAIWPCSPKGSNVYQWFLDNLYNKAEYNDLIYKVDGKKAYFIPARPTSCMDDGVEKVILSNGGRNDIVIINMWALYDKKKYTTDHWWGFFSPCISSRTGEYTSSIVGEGSCNQPVTTDFAGGLWEISASASYMMSQTSLPFAAPGKMRGLTLQRLFDKILKEKPPYLFLSSFNEHIGGRQAPAYHSNVAFNMGLPNDPQKDLVWVDTYGYEYSRDVEPTKEGGDYIWRVLSSCIHLYKDGKTCAEEPTCLCCTTEDKDVFRNVWSLHAKGKDDHLLTIDENEKSSLVKSGVWEEVCNSIPGPSVFCVDTSLADGRAGPFMVYSKEVNNTKPLYRCFIEASGTHFFSPDPHCENQKTESLIGYVAKTRGGEMLRELRRCLCGSAHVHSLDLKCDVKDAGVFGYVK